MNVNNEAVREGGTNGEVEGLGTPTREQGERGRGRLDPGNRQGTGITEWEWE